MKGIYLCSYKAHHENYNLDYNDVKKTSIHVNVVGDMMGIDLSGYDFVIATPPCNYWSRANYRRETSVYAQSTKHLLIDIIDKLIKLGKPFIIENVRNNKLMNQYGLLDKDCYILQHGRHTYWTNVIFDLDDIKQTHDFKAANKKINNGMWVTPAGKVVRSNGVVRLKTNSQGGDNVYQVIERFLKVLYER